MYCRRPRHWRPTMTDPKGMVISKDASPGPPMYKPVTSRPRFGPPTTRVGSGAIRLVRKKQNRGRTQRTMPPLPAEPYRVPRQILPFGGHGGPRFGPPTTPMGAAPNSHFWGTWRTEIWTPYYRIGSDAIRLVRKTKNRGKNRRTPPPLPAGPLQHQGPSERPAPTCYVLYSKM